MTFLAPRQPRGARLAVGTIILFVLPISLALGSAMAGRDSSLSGPGHRLPQSNEAAILRVCASGCATYDYRTISQAIAAASSGDEIHVARGTYVELLNVTNKSLTLLGGYSPGNWGVRAPDDFPTIIDGNDQGVVVTLFSTTGQHTGTIDGFTITGGHSTGSGGGFKVSRYQATITNNKIYDNDAGWGGGIYVQYSTAMNVSNNTLSYNTASQTGGGMRVWRAAASIWGNDILRNTASGNGGGIFVDDATVTIANNRIRDNVSQNAGGGGIYFHSGATGTVMGNRIVRNDATVGGGGISVLLYSDVTIRDNDILDNTTSSAGGGITVSRSEVTIEDNDFVGNVGVLGGGGMQIILDSTGLISGNRFSNNQAGAVSDGGGAIHFWLSSPDFISNTVVSNTAGRGGGGVNISMASPQILNNVITDNDADLSGGGVNINVDSYPTLIGNYIARNTAVVAGGGIHIYDSAPTISRNEIVDNEAPKGGGLTFNHSAGFELINNIIARNKATDEGGGVQVGVNSSGNIINNTFVSNNVGSAGEAINFRSPATARIANNILVWNDYGIRARSTSPTVEYNNAWQNSVANYEGVSGGPGRISRDPQFANPTVGDYHLTAGSGVIDAGTGTGAPSLDFDGDPRPLDGDVDGSALWDIGADEYQYPVWVIKQVNPPVADPGDMIAYTITYRNNAGDTATGVVVTDILSQALMNPSFTFSGANITPRVGTTYVWDVENLGPGEGGTITVSAQIDPDITTPASILNRAEFYAVEIGAFSDDAPIVVGGLRTYFPLMLNRY